MQCVNFFSSYSLGRKARIGPFPGTRVVAIIWLTNDFGHLARDCVLGLQLFQQRRSGADVYAAFAHHRLPMRRIMAAAAIITTRWAAPSS